MTDPIERLKKAETGLRADPALRESLRARLRAEFDADASAAAPTDAAVGDRGAGADVVVPLRLNDPDIAPTRRGVRGRRVRVAVLSTAAAAAVVAGVLAVPDDPPAEDVGTVDMADDAQLASAVDAYCATTGAVVAELADEYQRPLSEQRLDLAEILTIEIEAATVELDRLIVAFGAPGAADANDRTKRAAGAYREAASLGRNTSPAVADLLTAHRDTLAALSAAPACVIDSTPPGG